MTVDVARLRALLDESTPGPWTTGEDWACIAAGPDSVIHATYQDMCGDCNGFNEDDADVEVSAEDLDLIVAAVNALPALLAAVEERDKLVGKLRTAQSTLAYLDHRFPCDGGCGAYQEPQEECSRDGRTPDDLWEIIGELRKEIDGDLVDERDQLLLTVARVETMVQTIGEAAAESSVPVQMLTAQQVVTLFREALDGRA